MKTLSVAVLISVLVLSLVNVSCKKPEIQDEILQEKVNVDTIVKPVVIINLPIIMSPVINDSILYQSDFSESTGNILNGSMKLDYYNFMTYTISNNTFMMTRNEAGLTDDKIYSASGLIWKNIIPDSALVINFNIFVDSISNDNDYILDIYNPILNIRTSHYLAKGNNNFDFNVTKYRYSGFQISAFGKMPYGGKIPYTIVMSNIIIVKVKQYK